MMVVLMIGDVFQAVFLHLKLPLAQVKMNKRGIFCQRAQHQYNHWGLGKLLSIHPNHLLSSEPPEFCTIITNMNILYVNTL